MLLFNSLHMKSLRSKTEVEEDPLALLSQVIPEQKLREYDLVCVTILITNSFGVVTGRITQKMGMLLNRQDIHK